MGEGVRCVGPGGGGVAEAEAEAEAVAQEVADPEDNAEEMLTEVMDDDEVDIRAEDDVDEVIALRVMVTRPVVTVMIGLALLVGVVAGLALVWSLEVDVTFELVTPVETAVVTTEVGVVTNRATSSRRHRRAYRCNSGSHRLRRHPSHPRSQIITSITPMSHNDRLSPLTNDDRTIHLPT